MERRPTGFGERKPRVRIDDFRTEEDQRVRHDGYSDDTKDMYNAMLTLILDHKKELQKIPAASSLESATIWARKRGLRAGTEDFNNDGIPETVVYNKAGKPWIINGYKLKASDYPQRNAFYTKFPTSEARAGESMKSWLQDQVYDVRDDPTNPWRKHIRKTEFGRQLEESGYKMPTKPKKKLSVFNIFSKLVAPILKEYYESEDGYPITLLGEQAGPNCIKVLKKIVSPISMYRMLYMKMVEREYFFWLITNYSNRFGRLTYNQFKQYVKNNDNSFYQWFKTNYLTPEQTQLKPNKITPLIIQGQIVKGDIQWDGSDPDDAIVFMIGLANMEDEECNSVLRNNEAAGDFLLALSDKHHERHKQAMKAIAKWKKVASTSQKKFFKDQIQWLFENQDALNRFTEAVSNGINTLANTTDQAQQESAEQPSSPLRPPAQGAPQPNESPEPLSDDEEEDENLVPPDQRPYNQ